LLVVLIGLSFLAHALNIVVLCLSLFLMLIVLIQKGKGGGLSGAFGGSGGSSPFGSKSGTMFTRLTIIVAGIWALFIVFSVWNAQANNKAADTESDKFTPTVSRSLGEA
jgi:preprotein translocase subunit SecG